jgi:CubicO group peptidase (beta-lactamase class C family)
MTDKLDGVVREHDFLGTVLVIRRGERLLARGYGMADLENGVPNALHTKFRIGSITKMFTAMAVMMLAERGKLRFEDLLSGYLDDIPDHWSDITLHHLLSNSSGIVHSWALPGFTENMSLRATTGETIQKFVDQPLVASPGEKYHYSGAGFFVLSQVVEKVSGQSYEAFLREHILEPLEMADTGCDHPDPILPHRARGYAPAEDGLINSPMIYMPILTGGGNLYSTVEDLAKWDAALNAGKLISESSYERMFTPVLNNYAYGWRVMVEDGRRSVMHGGGVSGFNTFLLRFPEDDVCVIVLSNVKPAPSNPIAQKLAGVVFGQ